jgi:hypothetical protein
MISDRTIRNDTGVASLRDTEQLAQELDRLVGEIRSELTGDVDFESLVSICDEMSERADAFAQTFSTIDTVLMEQVERITGGSSGRSSKTEAGSRS